MTPYRLVVVVHLLGVILWMGGLLALSRILGYHCREDPSVRPRYSWLELRLDTMVAMPGAALTLLTGFLQIYLLGRDFFRVSAWLHHKLLLVIVMLVVHVVLTRRHRAIARGPQDAQLPRALFGALHGILGLLLLGVLFLAVMKWPLRG